MKRTILMISMLVLTLSVTALAQDNKSKVTRAKGEHAFTVGKTVYGKVTAIDAAKIVIENEFGAKKEIKLDTKTKLLNTKNKAFKLSDFASGSMVKVTFREVDMTATVVQENVKK